MKKLDGLQMKEELSMVALDLSPSNTLINKIGEIITDIRRIVLGDKTRA
jgi:hypothetical protein